MLPQWGHILNNSDIYKLLYFITLKSYNVVYMGWCLTAFVFLKYERWIVVYGAVSYYGFTFLVLWAAFYHTFNHFFRSSSRKLAERIRSCRTATRTNQKIRSLSRIEAIGGSDWQLSKFLVCLENCLELVFYT